MAEDIRPDQDIAVIDDDFIPKDKADNNGNGHVPAEAVELADEPSDQAVEKPRRWQRVVKGLGKLAACGAVTGAVGIMAIPAQTTIGPHAAEVRPTLDSTQTIDLGLLDLMTKPSDLPVLGFHVTPKGVTGDDSQETSQTEFSEGDIKQYAQFYEHIDQWSIAKDVIKHGGFSALYGTAAVAGAYLALGRRRRQEILEWVNPHNQAFRIALAAGVVASGVGLYRIATPDHQSANVDSRFDGTALEGWRIHSKLGQVMVNGYVADGLEVVENINRFTETASNNLKEAADGAELLHADDENITVQSTVSLKCNVPQMRVNHEIAELYNPTLWADAGDVAIGGSAFDGLCISRWVDASEGTPAVVTDGNHNAIDQLMEQGSTIIDGKRVFFEGLPIIAGNSPRTSANGQTVEGDQTEEEMGREAGLAACVDGGAAFAFFNEPSAATAAAYEGCVDMVFTSGGQGVQVVEARNGRLIPVYSSPGSGGAEEGQITFAELKVPAETAIFQFNKLTGRIRYQLVTTYPDGVVDISPILTLPGSTRQADFLQAAAAEPQPAQ